MENFAFFWQDKMNRSCQKKKSQYVVAGKNGTGPAKKLKNKKWIEAVMCEVNG
jgi:hypothetical protein